MKKLVFLSAVLFLAVFILPPGSGNGEYNVSKPIIAASSLSPFLPSSPLVADGNPGPPFPPNPHATLVADGNPGPPFPPNPSATSSGLLA